MSAEKGCGLLISAALVVLVISVLLGHLGIGVLIVLIALLLLIVDSIKVDQAQS